MSSTIHKTHISVAQNASGRNLNVPVYTIDSGQPGPNVYIQSSIHGAEVQGNVVIFHLIKALQAQTISGKVTLVPNCNPVGTNIKAGEYTLGRFDPVNGTNWNRGYHYDETAVTEFATTVSQDESMASITARFKSHLLDGIQAKQQRPWGLGLAQQLNLRLQTMAAQADIVLDLHNGPVSTRHLYVPEYLHASAALFSIPHVIFIPNHFAGALDEATFCPWWTLADILSKRYDREYDFGIAAFTLEMGSQEVIDFTDGKQDAASIMAYLRTQGVLPDCKLQPSNMRRVGVYLNDYNTLFTDFGGMVEYVAQPGEYIQAGQPLARVLNIDDLDTEDAVQTINAPCDLIPMLHFPSASVLSGTQLYKCFTEYFVITERTDYIINKR